MVSEMSAPIYRVTSFFDLFNLYIMSVNCFSNVPAFEGSKSNLQSIFLPPLHNRRIRSPDATLVQHLGFFGATGSGLALQPEHLLHPLLCSEQMCIRLLAMLQHPERSARQR